MKNVKLDIKKTKEKLDDLLLEEEKINLKLVQDFINSVKPDLDKLIKLMKSCSSGGVAGKVTIEISYETDFTIMPFEHEDINYIEADGYIFLTPKLPKGYSELERFFTESSLGNVGMNDLEDLKKALPELYSLNKEIKTLYIKINKAITKFSKSKNIDEYDLFCACNNYIYR